MACNARVRLPDGFLSDLLGAAMTHADIGNLTFGLRDNTTDLAEIWVNHPWRRREFGEREIADIRAAVLKLNLLLSAIEVTEAA